MKFAMIGSGAAGSCFAAFLRKAGADITLVDPYKEHMDKVAADGLDFTIYPDERYHIDGFKTAYTADDIGIMDAVIFMTKSTQLDAAVKGAAPCIGPETVLVSLMNGLGNEEKLLKVAGPERVIYGSGVMGTELKGLGACEASFGIPGVQMNFGPVEKSELNDKVGKELERLFIAGGCDTILWDDVKPMIWRKVIINSVFNPISALLRLKVKDFTRDMNGMGLAIATMNECIAVANKYGVPITTPELLSELKDSSGSGIQDYYPSMAQDMLMHQRQTEINTLNGAIVKYGKAVGVPTPVNTVITQMVSCIQKNYEKQYKEEE